MEDNSPLWDQESLYLPNVRDLPYENKRAILTLHYLFPIDLSVPPITKETLSGIVLDFFSFSTDIKKIKKRKHKKSKMNGCSSIVPFSVRNCLMDHGILGGSSTKTFQFNIVKTQIS